MSLEVGPKRDESFQPVQHSCEIELCCFGVRTHVVFVKFEKPFESTPNVMIGLTGYETMPDTSGITRISSRAENISPTGFVIKIWTSEGSQVNSVAGSWLAIGK